MITKRKEIALVGSGKWGQKYIEKYNELGCLCLGCCGFIMVG